MNAAKVAAVLRAHTSGQEWWDPVTGQTQVLCSCREWTYDHPQHVADILTAVKP